MKTRWKSFMPGIPVLEGIFGTHEPVPEIQDSHRDDEERRDDDWNIETSIIMRARDIFNEGILSREDSIKKSAKEWDSLSNFQKGRFAKRVVNRLSGNFLDRFMHSPKGSDGDLGI